MKQNVPAIVQFHSVTDHLVPVEIARRVRDGLLPESRYVETEDDGHFQDDDYDDVLWPHIAELLGPQQQLNPPAKPL
jgi:hypothetical protein